jgi:RNA polymerase sigma factor (sigma-70 family)
MSQHAYQPDVADVYVAYRHFLVRLARGEFRVPEEDAEAIVHEIFVSYIRGGRSVADRRAWLVAAVCNASRTYWRRRAKFSDAAGRDGNDDGDAARRVENTTRVSQILRRLSDRDQRILRLHYLEGHSAGEIARILDTTPRYAEKLLHLSLTRARKLFGDET